jgi:peptide deformylase
LIIEIQIGRDNPILRQLSTPVRTFDKKLKKLVKDMGETMLAKDGVGLAAPQIGINKRLLVLNFQLDKKNTRPIGIINPSIINSSRDLSEAEEGCLSLPGENARVIRPARVTVEFQNENGNSQILELTGLNARAVQHEIDHLDGILFVDRAEGRIENPVEKFPKPELDKI